MKALKTASILGLSLLVSGTSFFPDVPNNFISGTSVDGKRGGGPGATLPRRGAVLIGGKLVPADQVRIAEKEADGCPTRHLHAAQGDSVTAFDGTSIADPDPFGCGYGKLQDFSPVQVFVLDIPDLDYDGIPDTIDDAPTDADADNDGTPDGAEDSDGDGLSDAFELWVSRTDRDVPDSNGNGNDDSVTFVLSKARSRHITIPVIINIYNESVTEERAREAVDKSNIVLKQARIRLQVTAVNLDATEGDDGSGGGTAADGNFTEQEFRKVAKAGRQELAGSPQSRGLKIAFAHQLIMDGQATDGVSMRRVPVIAVTPTGGTADQIGSTIAHEFFHTSTVDGHPVDGSPEDTPGNIMTPSEDGRGEFIDSKDPDEGIENLVLTDSQMEFVWGDGIPTLYGIPGTKKSPAVKREYQRGSALDAVGEIAGSSYLDIHAVDIASHTDDEDIHILLVLADLFPDSGDVDGVYRLRFDTDDNTLTGEIAEIAGVDRTITIFVERNTQTNGLVIGAELYTVESGSSRLLTPTPQRRTVERIVNQGSIPNLDVVDLFELHVPRELLDLTAANVPASVSSFPGASSFSEDVVLVEFNRELWLTEPTLALPVEHVQRGDLVPFSLTDLTPGASYDLYLDSVLVHSGTLDASGDDAGHFTVPAEHPYGFCFVTAVDSAALLAASALLNPFVVFEDGFDN